MTWLSHDELLLGGMTMESDDIDEMRMPQSLVARVGSHARRHEGVVGGDEGVWDLMQVRETMMMMMLLSSLAPTWPPRRAP